MRSGWNTLEKVCVCVREREREREREGWNLFGTDGAHANRGSPSGDTRTESSNARILSSGYDVTPSLLESRWHRDWNRDQIRWWNGRGRNLRATNKELLLYYALDHRKVTYGNVPRWIAPEMSVVSNWYAL